MFLEWNRHRAPYELRFDENELAHVPIGDVCRRVMVPFFNTYRPQRLVMTWSDGERPVGVDWSLPTRLEAPMLATLAAVGIAQLCEAAGVPYVAEVV